MLRFFNRLLLVFVLISFTVLITLSNSAPATIRLGSRFELTSYAGVIYLAVFGAGCVATSIVGLFFGLKAYLRERQLRASEKNRQAFFQLFLTARNYMAAFEWQKARELWETVLRKDSDNVIARVELSQCLEESGDLREALRVLDSTRASSRRSTEVLFRAAELNKRLGNGTGASDNLALIVADSPSRRALELARDTSEEMSRIDDALEYQSELDKLGYNSEASVAVRTRITFAQILRDAPEENTLRETLQGFVRRNATFVPALEKLASLQIARGLFDEAAELLVKAAKASKGDLRKWHAVIDLWLHQAPGDSGKRAERAVAAARASTQEARGADRIRAELTVVQTLLAVNKVEEARKTIESIPSLAEREGIKLDGDLARTKLMLKGSCLARLGLAKDTASIWQQLLEPSQASTSNNGAYAGVNTAEPSPSLSTP
jgi:tetratricopeptide (TPR) repeat protein